MKTGKDAYDIQPNALSYKLGDQVEQLDELIASEGDGKAFFKKTHITPGMQDLISKGFSRLAGASSQAVFHLKQAMDCGKTHLLVGFGLLAKHPDLRKTYCGGISQASAFASADIAVFNGRNNPDRFFWGEIASQLGRGDQFRPFWTSGPKAPDEKDWLKLLEGDRPVLILLDEMAPYFHYLDTQKVGNGTVADISTRAFANLLTAAGKKKNVCVIVSDLSAAYDSGAKLIHRALEDARSELGRQEPDITSDEYPIQFGRYRLLKKIGSGAMAVVYRAEMQSVKHFCKIVAIKILHMHLIKDPHLHQLFFNEARLGGFLKHPNIIETYDFNELDGRYFLAMEYVDGQNFNQILSSHRVMGCTVPFDVILQLMIQTCWGLDYAHKATDTQGQPLKMVHRDLKPSNILINNYGQVKIADFGVARAMSNVNLADTIADGMIKGSIRYLSPEQALSQSKLDHRSDIFAAGLILFELLTNRFFYEGNRLEQVFNMAKKADMVQHLKRLPDIPFRHQVMNILYRALSPKKQDRFSSAMQMATAMEGILAQIPVKTNLSDWLASITPVQDCSSEKKSFALTGKDDQRTVAEPSQQEIAYASDGINAQTYGTVAQPCRRDESVCYAASKKENVAQQGLTLKVNQTILCRGNMNFSITRIKTKLLLAGTLLTIIPLLFILLIVLYQNRLLVSMGETESLKRAYTDLNHIVENLYTLAESHQEVTQKNINSALNVARDIVSKAGGISFSHDQTFKWRAMNQYTQTIEEIALPKMKVGYQLIKHISSPSQSVLVVDEVQRLVNVTCTIFQRMNSGGDMLRIATNVINTDGQRAIGTYIPAINPNGEPNPVVSTVLNGQTFRGRAYVVDKWYITAYEPIYTNDKKIVGIIYVGIPQENVKSLRKAIVDMSIGTTGFVTVLDSSGKYVISRQGKQDDIVVLKEKDAEGNLYIRNRIQAAKELSPYEIGHQKFLMRDGWAAKPVLRETRFVYFKTWDWIITAEANAAEFTEVASKLSKLGNKSALTIVAIGLVTLAITGLVWIYIANSIVRTIKGTTNMGPEIYGNRSHGK